MGSPCLVSVHPSWCACFFHTAKLNIFLSLAFMVVSSSYSVSLSTVDSIFFVPSLSAPSQLLRCWEDI